MGWKAKAAGVGLALVVVAMVTDGEEEPPSTGIPADYQALYEAAGATCENLDAALLAAIGLLESDHGRSALAGVHSGENEAGAMGPMQFVASTWDGVRAQHPEVGANVYNAAHAIPAAAHLLCDTGVRDGDVEGAVWMYNHDDAYVEAVRKQADVYRNGGV